ncbi:MAG: DUF6265 family protein [Pseudomonadota bacterium]
MLRTIWYCLVFSLCPLFSSEASEPHTENTFRLSDGEVRPKATLQDASWLVGSWAGTAFGQRFEETWNPPSAGTMVGMFKLFSDEGIAFYELLLLTEENDTLNLKVKHFNEDFSAWEEKEDFVHFKLVKLKKDALHFGGISFYKRNENHIDAFIVMRNGDDVREHPIVFQRVLE